jgi:membrane protein
VGVVSSVDKTQRRYSVLGLPIGILYKYFDDQGNYLAAIATYYAIIAIFPLLLLASSVLGFVIQHNHQLATKVINSAIAQFPIVGEQLGRPGGLKGSVAAVIIGGVAALYGALGLGQAIQNAINVAWAVPRNKRPNPIRLRVRSLALLSTTGIAVLGITVISTIGTDSETFGPGLDFSIRWLVRLATVLLTGALLTVIFRLAAARRHHFGVAAPGAFAVAVMWQTLQYGGTVYVDRVVVEAHGMNGTFALILGLIGIIYVASVMGVLGIEVNVVLARRLWPRSLGALFTDNTDLTPADLRAYALYVRAQQHKQIQNVDVTFTDPSTGEIRLPD